MCARAHTHMHTQPSMHILERTAPAAHPMPCMQAMTPAAVNSLAVRGFDPIFGGRPVKRVIQRELETPLARALLGAEFQVCVGVCV